MKLSPSEIFPGYKEAITILNSFIKLTRITVKNTEKPSSKAIKNVDIYNRSVLASVNDVSLSFCDLLKYTLKSEFPILLDERLGCSRLENTSYIRLMGFVALIAISSDRL